MTWNYLERLPALKEVHTLGILVRPASQDRGLGQAYRSFKIPLCPPLKKGDFKPTLLKGGKGRFWKP